MIFLLISVPGTSVDDRSLHFEGDARQWCPTAVTLVSGLQVWPADSSGLLGRVPVPPSLESVVRKTRSFDVCICRKQLLQTAVASKYCHIRDTCSVRSSFPERLQDSQTDICLSWI